VLVAFLVATGRWGSHLGLSTKNIYVTDVGLVVTVVWAMVRHRGSFRLSRFTLVALLPIAAIVVWATARFLINATLDPEALRDLAPFLYSSVAVVGLVTVGEEARRRTLLVLQTALVLHAVWVTASLYFDIATYPLSGGLLYVFEIRSDFDSAMLAVLSALALRVAIRADVMWHRAASAAVGLWPAYILFQTGSRAGALALVAAVGVVVASVLRTSRIHRRQVIAGAALVLVVTAVVLPSTSLYERMAGDSRFAVNSAAGTTSARQLAWRAVVEYVSESPSRAVFGVGPGPDVLVASGARPYFGQVHQGDIRVPHNVLLTYYARLGLVGLGFLLVWLATWSRATWRRIAGRTPGVLDLTYILVSVTLLLTSMFGVILESPFGAVPFFWVVGQLVTRRGDEPDQGHPTTEASASGHSTL
jgi:O-antigen ligase